MQQAVVILCPSCDTAIRIAFDDDGCPARPRVLLCPGRCAGEVRVPLPTDEPEPDVSAFVAPDSAIGFALGRVRTLQGDDGAVYYPVMLEQMGGSVSDLLWCPAPLPEVFTVGAPGTERRYRIYSTCESWVSYNEGEAMLDDLQRQMATRWEACLVRDSSGLRPSVQ